MQDILNEIESLGIDVEEKPLVGRLKGLYSDMTIWLNSALTNAEKRCILAEELYHFYTSEGDILDMRILGNRKQERVARVRSYRRLITLDDIVNARLKGINDIYELADHYDVTVEVVIGIREYYKNKYGIVVHNGHEINFHTMEFKEIV